MKSNLIYIKILLVRIQTTDSTVHFGLKISSDSIEASGYLQQTTRYADEYSSEEKWQSKIVINLVQPP